MSFRKLKKPLRFRLIFISILTAVLLTLFINSRTSEKFLENYQDSESINNNAIMQLFSESPISGTDNPNEGWKACKDENKQQNQKTCNNQAGQDNKWPGTQGLGQLCGEGYGLCKNCMLCVGANFYIFTGQEGFGMYYPSEKRVVGKCYLSPNGVKCVEKDKQGMCFNTKCITKCTKHPDCPPAFGGRYCKTIKEKDGIIRDQVVYRKYDFECRKDGKCTAVLVEENVLRTCRKYEKCINKPTYATELNDIYKRTPIADCLRSDLL